MTWWKRTTDVIIIRMFIEILLKILTIFIIVAMGVIASKTHLLPEDSLKTLNSFVLNVATPCLVIHSMQRDSSAGFSQSDMIWSFAAFGIVTLLLLVISSLVLKPVKSIREEDKGIYKIQMAFTNCGFMGYPLVTAILGEYALFLAILMNIVFSVLLYSGGIFALQHRKGEKIMITKLLGQLLNMPFMASLLGIIIFITGFQIPSFIDESLSMVAATLSPVAMFIVGINLSRTKIRNIIMPRNALLCFCSLIAVPALTLGVDLLLPVSNEVLVTHVFLMAMPSAAVTTILCYRYNRNALLASEGVASTTFISLGTLTLWAYFLTLFFL